MCGLPTLHDKTDEPQAQQDLCLLRAVLAHALVNEPVKNIPHYLGGFFINHKCVFVLRVFHVPVGGKCADKFAFPALLTRA